MGTRVESRETGFTIPTPFIALLRAILRNDLRSSRIHHELESSSLRNPLLLLPTLVIDREPLADLSLGISAFRFYIGSYIRGKDTFLGDSGKIRVADRMPLRTHGLDSFETLSFSALI